jgi:hypothetical protein
VPAGSSGSADTGTAGTSRPAPLGGAPAFVTRAGSGDQRGLPGGGGGRRDTKFANGLEVILDGLALRLAS